MLAEATPAIDILNNIEIRSYRARSYVVIKSSAIQRWAAKLGGEYYTLTTQMWKGSYEKPAHAKPCPNTEMLVGQKTTLYFPTEEAAMEAAEAFLTRLAAKGIRV